jgi:hypothetical protein
VWPLVTGPFTRGLTSTRVCGHWSLVHSLADINTSVWPLVTGPFTRGLTLPQHECVATGHWSIHSRADVGLINTAWHAQVFGVRSQTAIYREAMTTAGHARTARRHSTGHIRNMHITLALHHVAVCIGPRLSESVSVTCVHEVAPTVLGNRVCDCMHCQLHGSVCSLHHTSMHACSLIQPSTGHTVTTHSAHTQRHVHTHSPIDKTVAGSASQQCAQLIDCLHAQVTCSQADSSHPSSQAPLPKPYTAIGGMQQGAVCCVKF